MDDIISGYFFVIMMVDWVNGDKDLFVWCEVIGKIVFENVLKVDGIKIFE